MKQKINNLLYGLLYGYVPGEFLPVWEGGHLRNRRAFVRYKIGKVVSQLAKR